MAAQAGLPGEMSSGPSTASSLFNPCFGQPLGFHAARLAELQALWTATEESSRRALGLKLLALALQAEPSEALSLSLHVQTRIHAENMGSEAKVSSHS